MSLVRGTVIVCKLDPTVGHEQHGVRPCIVVSDPAVTEAQRYPLMCVVPVTGTPCVGLLHPTLEPGKSGLTKQSFALVGHLRAVDKRRVIRALGEISRTEMMAVDEGLGILLGMGEQATGPGMVREQ